MKRKLKIFKRTFIGIIIFITLIGVLADEYQKGKHNYRELEADHYELQDTIAVINRIWDTYGLSTYDIEYKVQSETNRNAYEFRNSMQNFSYSSYKQYFNQIYRVLYNEQKSQIDFLLDSLKIIKEERQLNRDEFAKVIVSMVQDIPYTLVLESQKCSEQWDYEGPCIEGQRFGIFSPLEFLYNLKGDCDTRTLLLFTILKELSYNPAILNSAQYEHSILAVDIQTSGDYVEQGGIQYYVWETTAMGWEPGMLPPSCSNLDYWEIVLT